jgi:1-acyl-sn-glycerol-3-phosphate acyltransferase
MKKTNIFRTIWIMLNSCCNTLWLSIVAIYLASFGTPKQMDQLLYTWSRRLLKAVKLSYRVYNPSDFKVLPNQAYIIMSNHASLYDIPLIFTCVPGRIRMIAKKELMQVPIWGRAMKGADFIAIDRTNSAQAIKDLAAAKEKMETGIAIWMAPEGTRSRNGKLNIFKKGGFMLALETGAIIVPVGIRGADKILPAKTWNFSLGEHVEIHIGAPIDTRQYDVKSRNELIRAVRNSIAQAAAIEAV